MGARVEAAPTSPPTALRITAGKQRDHQPRDCESKLRALEALLRMAREYGRGGCRVIVKSGGRVGGGGWRKKDSPIFTSPGFAGGGPMVY